MNYIEYDEQEIERIQYILSPVDGKIISRSKIKDTVFSKNLFGECVYIHPKSRKILSPVNGIVDKIEKGGHSVTIISDLGTPICLYIGSDIAWLEGKLTKIFVSEGDRVKTGDVLTICDFNEMERLGYESKVIVAVMNEDNILGIIDVSHEKVKRIDKIFAIIYHIHL